MELHSENFVIILIEVRKNQTLSQRLYLYLEKKNSLINNQKGGENDPLLFTFIHNIHLSRYWH